jgi:tetratricopeptide (TPR) repeat protein
MKALSFSLGLLLVLVIGKAGAGESFASSDFRTANNLFSDQKYREALVLYQRALSVPPDNVSTGDIHRRIGDSYFQLGDFQNALAAYRAAVSDPLLADKAQAQYWVGFCCYLVGRDAEAVNELLKVPALHPDANVWASTAYYWAGRASERMGRRDEAAEFYRKAAGTGTSMQGRFARKKAEAVTKSK